MSGPDVRAAFGKAVKDQRFEMRISQEELAHRAGLHRTYISDVERGARNPSLESIEKLAEALELSVSALFARIGRTQKADRIVEILLVEDDPADVELTLRAFRKARMTNRIHIVTDGLAAVDFVFGTGAHANRAGQPLPGVILLDLNLPKLGGLEVLRRIKADKRTRHIPVIVLTASDRDGDITACRRLGCESYLVKPVEFQKFSLVTPRLRLEWALKQANGGNGRKPS
jgi:CheY-like chemotaxis protein